MLTVEEFEVLLKDIDRLITAKDVADLILELIHDDNYIVESLNYNLKVFNGLKVTTLQYLIMLKLKLLVEGIDIYDYYGYETLPLDKSNSPVLETDQALLIHKIFIDQFLKEMIDEDMKNFELLKLDYPEYNNIDSHVFELAYNNGFSTMMSSEDYQSIFDELVYEDYSELEIELHELMVIEDYEETVSYLYYEEDVDESILKTKETITDIKVMIDMALDANDVEWFMELSERLYNLK